MRRELGLDQGASDGAIAAAAYQRWSENVFDRLDGSYLLAIWDPRQGRLLLGHDALGHHPVFYSPQPQALWFGSNVLTLSESGGSRTGRTESRWCSPHCCTGQPPARHSSRTFIVCAQVAIWRSHAIRRSANSSHFSPWLADDESELTEAQVNEQFEPTLLGAVSRCMELDPEGVMLSGGLDSVTIAALAAEYAATHHTPLITAVSGRRADTYTGEEPMQTATATALGMRHLVAKEPEWMGARGEIELSLDIIPELPTPSRIYWVGATMGFYRHTAAWNVHVLLTGSGGDNWASVGDAYAADNMRRLRLRQLSRFMYSYMDTGGMRSGVPRATSCGLAGFACSSTRSRRVGYHRRRLATTIDAPAPRCRRGCVPTRRSRTPLPQRCSVSACRR